MKYYQDNIFKELIVDNFAGGGGASTGIELALGRPVDIAINHDENAILMHTENHPYTQHFTNDVFAIDPLEVTDGRPVGLAWFSPDCTHFSKAKGGKPKKKEIRDLAWVVVKWAKAVKPRVIMLENVEEFKTWGPLDDKGYPIKEQSGQTFEQWLNALTDLGYEVESKELKACDYGAPTTRKRLFIIARCDGQPIVWPKPTHGEGKGLKPYKAAKDIIDWSVPGKSIFDRKKPLVENTLKRIVRGIDKFVIKNSDPFLIQYHTETKNSEKRVYDINNPILTLDGSNRYGIVTPTLMINNTGYQGSKTDEPVPTITTAKNHYLINPSIIPIGYGEAKGQKPRVNDSKDPLGTLVGTIKHNVVIPHIIKHYSGDSLKASDIKKPLDTITSIDHNGLCSAIISSYYGNGDNAGNIDKPLNTITAVERHGLVKVRFEKVQNSEIGYWPQIRSLLNKYGSYSIKDDELMIFEIDSIEYIMVDIEMRMLLPKELYAAQGFPPDYNFSLDGRMTKTEQIKKVGNSVSPQVATAIVRANMMDNEQLNLKTMSEFKHYAQYGSLKNHVRDKD